MSEKEQKVYDMLNDALSIYLGKAVNCISEKTASEKIINIVVEAMQIVRTNPPTEYEIHRDGLIKMLQDDEDIHESNIKLLKELKAKRNDNTTTS